VETVSETASADDWTCRVRLKSGRLPDLSRLVAHLAEMRVGANLRGVEAEVVGELSREGDLLYLRMPAAGERLRLAPLTRVVQWHVKRDHEQRTTRTERGAFRRLSAAEPRRSVRRVRVVGTLVESQEPGPYLLEVRRFEWLPAGASPEHFLSSNRPPDREQGD
jgi:hypothetical protein